MAERGRDGRRGEGLGVILFLIGLAIITILGMILREKREKRGAEEETYETLVEERDRVLERLRRLSARRAEGKISKEEYQRKRQALLKEIERIEDKLNKLER